MIDLVGLTPAEILRMEDLEPASSSIYLSGSLVDGTGNSGSDVDVFLISDGQPSGPLVVSARTHTVSIHFHGRRRVDFEYWTPASVHGIASRLRAIEVGSSFVAEALDIHEKLFIHRLRIGVPLVDPAGVDAWRSLFDFDHFRSYLRQEAIHRIDGAHEDLVGMLDDGHLQVALPRSAELVEHACDAYAFASGSSNPTTKWRPWIMERLGDDERDRIVREAYWRLSYPSPRDLLASDELARAHVVECIGFAERVVEWIQ